MLKKHLEQSRLLYFSKAPDAISVHQSQAFRWLCFDDVIQSIMHLRLPYRLTLPHHFALHMPLRHIRPVNILEFGLGGGNNLRFLQQVTAINKHVVVENSKVVIDCFNQFFKGNSKPIDIVCQHAEHFIETRNLADFDWLIFDVYQHNQNLFSHKALFMLIEKLKSHQTLTINFTGVSAIELTKLYQFTQQTLDAKWLQYQVPGYQNQLVHILPNTFQKTHNWLPARWTRYFDRYHELYAVLNR